MASTITETPDPPPYSASLQSDSQISPNPTSTTAPVEKTASHQRKYKTSIPLAQLDRYAAPTDCPVCGQRALTRLEYKVTTFTHLLACAFLCGTGILFWVPYAGKGMKNIHHHCGNPGCGVLLATWHRAPNPGWIEVREFY